MVMISGLFGCLAAASTVCRKTKNTVGYDEPRAHPKGSLDWNLFNSRPPIGKRRWEAIFAVLMCIRRFAGAWRFGEMFHVPT
jgi:hypothetical protein